MTAEEVLAAFESFLVGVPEGVILDISVAPGFGPPGDLVVTVKQPVDGGVAFSSTVAPAPHTRGSVEAAIARVTTDLARRVEARGF